MTLASSLFASPLFASSVNVLQALWLPALLGLVAGRLLDGMLRPMPRPFWRRAFITWCVELGSWGIQFAFWTTLVQRPWFAMAIMTSLHLLVVQVNNTKYLSLREPFLCQDFEYFTDAIRHPRLYIPFFGIGLTIAATLASLAAITTGLLLEPSLISRYGALSVAAVTLPLAMASIVALSWGLRRLPSCSLDPERDLKRLGLTTYLWAYGRLARHPFPKAAERSPFARHSQKPPASAGQLPHVVAIQSESFFDPRDWAPNITREILGNFDRIADEALSAGRLRVPAWGANTVRTECGFLTGLYPEALGVHRFNPYHQMNRQPLTNLAGVLKAMGYRTVCIHPYPASFYLRDKVFPQLGFDEFIDIHAFNSSQKDGQYIGDKAVASKIADLCEEENTRPLFIFAITMENHGPLNLESASDEDTERWHTAPPEPGCEELSVYLRHLHNADDMLASLANTLSTTSREGVLCWYGDHVPIMPDVYARFGAPNGLTDYLLWSTTQRKGAPSQTETTDQHDNAIIDIEQLGPLLIDVVLDDVVLKSATSTSRSGLNAAYKELDKDREHQ